MTTPRVTVPVEGLAGKLKAIRDKFLMPTPDKDFTDYAVMTRCIDALSAAPAPEGGAVSPGGWLIREADGGWYWTGKKIAATAALTEGLEVVSLSAPATREEAPAETTDCKTCAGNGEIVTDWDEYLSPPKGAPADHATADCPDCDGIGKVEAPAEAGEIGAEYDDAAHCVTLAACPPGLFLWNGTLGFKSEYGAMEPVGISPHHQQWKVGNRVDAYCADSGEYFWGGTSNHDDRAKLLVYPISAEAVAMVASHGPSAIRAQPQAREARDCGNGHQPGCDCDIAEEDVARSKPPAREDAQPVAWRAVWSDGTVYGEPKNWPPLDGASTYHGLMSRTIQPLYTHPAPDALRVAVEALEALAGEEGDCGEKVYVPCTWKPFREVARQALATLAALQAEQKGGA